MSTQEEVSEPLKLPQHIRLLLALSALCATQNPIEAVPPSPSSSKWRSSISNPWLKSVCKILEIDQGLLPPAIAPEGVISSAEGQTEEWTTEERARMAEILIEACLAASKSDSGPNDKQEQLRYTALARAMSYRALYLLGLPAEHLIPEAENRLSSTLFTAWKVAAEAEKQDQVESTRAAHSQGWGGLLGRRLATGAGVIAGGILVGVTGGLAAPAIAALLAPLGIGGLLAGGAAPVVLGTLFGVGGGGLAGRRVRERWKGVEEFSFIEVGAGTMATQEEIDDLVEARKRLLRSPSQQEEFDKADGSVSPTEKEYLDEKASIGDETLVDSEDFGKDDLETPDSPESLTMSETPLEASEALGSDRNELVERLLELSLQAGTRGSLSAEMDDTARPGLAPRRPTLNDVKDDATVVENKKSPSLTATIVVPGLLTISRTEAITAWRAICSSGPVIGPAPSTATAGQNGPVINYEPRRRRSSARSPILPSEKPQMEEIGPVSQSSPATSPIEKATAEMSLSEQAAPIDDSSALIPKSGLRDGRDIYLCRFETEKMLSTGRTIDDYIGNKLIGKLKGKVKREIIKRAALGAYFAAIKMPMQAYKLATMGLDNTWVQAQDRAKKAGRLLGEVIEERVQGERPVVLIGSSLGAYTVLEALLYLSTLPAPPGSRGPIPNYVESAYLISLPSAPTAEEWARCRGVVARRLVNAWSSADFVLASVVRVHEMVSRASTLSNGMMVAGLAPVQQPGIEDVDVSSVLRGHMELQAKIGEVLKIVDVDA